jgi:hypothetical protein
MIANPCSNCKKANMCKYPDEVKAFVEDLQGKAPALITVTIDCKENPKPIELPGFMNRSNNK